MDPCDSIEQNSGWLLKLIALAQKHGQPLRLSTKGAIFLIPEYQQAIAERPELFWVAFSMVTNDDNMAAKIERGCPAPSLRLEAMKVLTSMGASASLRLRPLVLNVTDRDKGYAELIKRAAGSGARAISYETMFYPQNLPKQNRDRWVRMKLHTGIDFAQTYRSFGKSQACMRPPYSWTENIMHKIAELAHAEGMAVGVSDPAWKQLTDYGCCCGIPPDDKVFGNWQREQCTNAIVNARDGANKIITFDDIRPPWANNVRAVNLINGGVGPLKIHETRNRMWADVLLRIWNNPSAQRSPMNYFQGALEIAGADKDGNLTYRYMGLTRQHRPSPWKV